MAKPKAKAAPKITKKMLDAIVQPMFRSFIILAMDCPGEVAYKAATSAHQAWFLTNLELFRTLDLDAFTWTEFLPATRAYIYALQAYANGEAGVPTFDSTVPDDGVDCAPVTYAVYRSAVWERDEEDWEDDESEPDEQPVGVPPATQQAVQAAEAAPETQMTQQQRPVPMTARRIVATRGNVSTKVAEAPAAPEPEAAPVETAPAARSTSRTATRQVVNSPVADAPVVAAGSKTDAGSKQEGAGTAILAALGVLAAKVDDLTAKVDDLQRQHGAYAQLSQQTSEDVGSFKQQLDEAVLGVNGIYAGVLFIVNSTLLEEPILDLCDLLPPDEEEAVQA